MDTQLRRSGSLAGWLPAFCALAPVAWCLSYGVAILVVGSRIGRQSSTTGIAVGLSLMVIPLFALMGLYLGRLLVRLLPPTLTARPLGPARLCVPLLLALIAVLAWRTASAPMYAADVEARPRILINTAGFDRSVGQLPATGFVRGLRIHDSLGERGGKISWDGGSASVADRGNELELMFASTGQSVNIPLPGIDYVLFVDAVVLEVGPGASPALALLITGRATGRRDLLAVVSAVGELVHLQLLDRFWDFREIPLATALSPAGSLIYVGSDHAHQLVFASAVAGD